MEQKIIEMLCEVKSDADLKNRINSSSSIIDDVGIDSLQMISFVLMLEDEFNVEIDFETFDYSHMSSIRSLAEFLKAC